MSPVARMELQSIQNFPCFGPGTDIERSAEGKEARRGRSINKRGENVKESRGGIQRRAGSVDVTGAKLCRKKGLLCAYRAQISAGEPLEKDRFHSEKKMWR